ncbi:MAG: VWA domain-containing protein, partial [Myxococcales bacterium]|nr:VWA domain-containing protein [Myxococcales bacterium]
SVDDRDLACNEICNLDSNQVTPIPTTTEFDPQPKPRPWLEQSGGVSNLPAGTDMIDALGCLLPQGVNGCGFESQLEAMYLSLVRSVTTNESNYGFIRSDASLLVLIVSDEVDCSYNKQWDSIFQQDGNKVFWADPNDSFPTSALCWNAGVTCTGDPGAYDSCLATNYDVNGNVTADENAAVLHPLSRYQGLLQGLQVDKQSINPDARIYVGLLAGVGEAGQISYAEPVDPQLDHDFGIEYACSDGTISGLPPVRMRETSEALGGGPNVRKSICASSYAPGLSELVGFFTSGC